MQCSHSRAQGAANEATPYCGGCMYTGGRAEQAGARRGRVATTYDASGIDFTEVQRQLIEELTSSGLSMDPSIMSDLLDNLSEDAGLGMDLGGRGRDCNSPAERARNILDTARHNLEMLDRLGNAGIPDSKSMTDLTHAVLYEFLPLALNKLIQEKHDRPTSEHIQTAASAAIALVTLLGFPVAFLEYMLCVPWSKMSHSDFTKAKDFSGDHMSYLQSPADARTLINMPIAPTLMEPFLNFLLNHDQQSVLPSILRYCQPELKGDSSLFAHRATPTRDTVAALLDGATSLHCAALRGSPAQVQYLLSLGANPNIKTAAGELPMELVPVCFDGQCSCPWASPVVNSADSIGGPIGGGRNARPRGYSVPTTVPTDCQSRDARTLLARKTISTCPGGLWNWFRMLILSFLCVLGFWGQYTTLLRPAIERHVSQREEERREQARTQAQELMDRMRREVQGGKKHLAAAKALHQEQAQLHGTQGRPRQESECVSTSGAGPSAPVVSKSLVEAAELAFESFVRAVHACQNLELRGGTLPKGFSEIPGAPVLGLRTGSVFPQESHVMEDEQAELYCGWAQAVLLKFRSCMCPGCITLAAQATRMAHLQVSRLFRRMERRRRRAGERWQAVGSSLASVVYTRCCLLLETKGRKSVTKEGLSQAEQCLKDWEVLEKSNLTNGDHLLDDKENGMAVACLREWSVGGAADIQLAEAMLGAGAVDQAKSLADTLEAAIKRDDQGQIYLRRQVSKEVVDELKKALSQAVDASAHVRHLAEEATTFAAREVDATRHLREVMTRKTSDISGHETVEILTKAVEAAKGFPNLSEEVLAATNLRDRQLQRIAAVEKLDASLELARAPVTKGVNGKEASTASETELTLQARKEIWKGRAHILQVAISDAQSASISVSKAKRLLRELQACAAAADVINRLDHVLEECTSTARQPASGALKSAMAAAEEVSSSLTATSTGRDANHGVSEAPGLSEVLKQRMVQVKCRMERKKAAEALARTLAACKAVSDLPKLESAILSARKVGAEELDMATYQSASELRGKLAEALRLKNVLADKLKTLSRQQRGSGAEESLAESVSTAIEEAEACMELLEPDIREAKEQLDRWKAAGVASTKLNKALSDCTSPSILSRAIQEASAAGVMVGEAKRILKIMYNLESWLATQPVVQSGGLAGIRSKIQAAESAGIKGPLVAGAKARLGRLLGQDAKDMLDTALKPRGEIARSADERRSALQGALDRCAEAMAEQASLFEAASKVLGIDAEAAEGYEGASEQSANSTASIMAGSLKELEAGQAYAKEVDAVVEVAKKALADACREQDRVEKERAEAERLRKEKADRERAEKEERDKERKEKSEVERQAREKAEKERKERGRQMAEAADRQRRIQNRKKQQAERQQQQQQQQQAGSMVHASPQQPNRRSEDAQISATQSSGSLAPRQGQGSTQIRQALAQAPAPDLSSNLSLPQTLMPGTQDFYQHEFNQQMYDTMYDLHDTANHEPSWQWSDGHLMSDSQLLQQALPDDLMDEVEGAEEHTEEDPLQKVDSWGHMITKDVLDTLDAPEWEDAAPDAADPCDLHALSRATANEVAQLLRAEDLSVPDEGAAVPPVMQNASELSSTAAAGDSSSQILEASLLGQANTGFGGLGQSVGGLPLAGMEYGGATMWSMPGGSSNDNKQQSGLSGLLPQDLGREFGSSLWTADLSGAGPEPEPASGFIDPPQGDNTTGSSVWGTAGGLGSGTAPSLFGIAPQTQTQAALPINNLWAETQNAAEAGGPARPDSSGAGSSGARAQDAAESKTPKVAGRVLRVPRICRYHLQGFCRDGTNCRFSHDKPQKAPQEVVPPAAPSSASNCVAFRPPPPPPAPRGPGQANSSTTPVDSEGFASADTMEVIDPHGAQDENASCCVCLEKPREVGLAHENGTLHVCICRECAERLKSRGFTQCPLCMEKITQFVHRIYL